MTSASRARHTDIAAALAGVRERVTRAAEVAGRDPDGVTLIVVTKFFPVTDVRILFDLGVRDFGENREQEASVKFAGVRDWAPGSRVHFIGQLQTNKAASVAAYADVVHAVDRPRLVAALDRGARQAGRTLDVLLQVELDESAPGPGGRRGGASIASLGELATAVDGSAALTLRGVMAVAPFGVDPAAPFGLLARVSAALRLVHPEASWISAGMSGDLEAAITHGATHLRVGTAILGSRPPLR